MTIRITDNFLQAWRWGHSAGEGYCVGSKGDTCLEAAKKAGLVNILSMDNGGAIGYTTDGDMVVVQDMCGPLAVNVTKYLL